MTFRTNHQEIVLLMNELPILIDTFHPTIEGDCP